MKEQENAVENLEEKSEEIVEEVKAELEETAEAVTEEVNVVEEEAEESVDAIENAEEVSEEVPEADLDSQLKNLKKNAAAELLVKKAKIIVDDAENQLDQCKLLLSNDLKDYDIAKQALKDNGMDASENLLAVLGYEAEEEESEVIEDTVVFEPKKALAPIVIQDVSSGAFTGFILALIAGFITIVGMVYVATEKIGMTLNISNVPTPESLAPVLKWYGTLVGITANQTVGMIVIALAALLVMWIVYKIRVSIKAGSNVHMAKAQLVAAEEYSVQKGTCKEEMDKVDVYIHEAIETLTMFQVILNEQKGKLERIKHFEDEKIETSDFHHKSTLEMKDTQELITVIKDFMSVPMSEEGKLSGKSSLFLHRAKSKIQKVIERLY